MAFDPQATADLVERVIKTALTPVMARVRALEAQTPVSRPATLDRRQQAHVAKAAAEARLCIDEHLMMLQAGLSADGADASTIDAALAWARSRTQPILADYQRDVRVQLTVAAWTPATRAAAPRE